MEAHNFEIRKHLLEFDDVMNRQRRSDLLDPPLRPGSNDVKHLMLESIEQLAAGVVATHVIAGQEERL